MRCLATAALLAGLVVPPAFAQQPAEPQQPTPQQPAGAHNAAISAKLTCRALLNLLKPATRNTGGLAIIWLDGYVAGNAADPGLPEDWIHDVAGGVGALCRLSMNADRLVIDVIAELRQQYRTTHPKPAASQ